MAEFVDQIPQQPGLAFEEKTHQYILNGTQVLPSVTTLMKPLSDTLYAGIRPETLQAAAERGTEVHSAIEDYVTLGITDISEARRGYFEAFLRWMKDYNVQPLSVEHRAYHPALGYAGTLDMLCTLSKSDTDPQVLTLVDFKTSATVNKMLTGVQLEAYEQMLAATGLQVEQKAIVHLQADGRYQMPVYRKNDAESWRVFMACLTIHKQWYDFQTKKRKDADRKRVERHRKRFEEEALANGQERQAGGDKKEFAPHVHLTQQQFDSLAEEYGTMAANKFVYVLDEYKGRTNKVYHDDYSAILKWVVEKVSKEDPAAIQKKQVGGSKFSIPEVEF